MVKAKLVGSREMCCKLLADVALIGPNKLNLPAVRDDILRALAFIEKDVHSDGVCCAIEVYFNVLI